MGKRNDLQWLRALAISAVLAFHLQPKIFCFGYLGVDIFFVISGYLMTSILSKCDSNFSFYLRRIKRIFPIYFFVILIFFVMGFCSLLPSHFQFLKYEVIWSLIFANNFPSMFHQKEYFEMISEFKFFLHTWSLSVEIQFYLIAPFFIKFIISSQMPLRWTSIFAIVSCLLQMFIPNNAVAFGLVSCRIWQFLVGTCAYLFENSSNDSSDGYVILSQLEFQEDPEAIAKPANYGRKSVNFLLFLFLGFICFVPLSSFLDFNQSSSFFRVLVTIVAGIFIASNAANSFYLPRIFDVTLIYIGDVSYTVYLIHWPLIVFFKYFQISLGDFFTLLCIIALTLIIYECFEKPFGKLSWPFTILGMALCLFIITVILFIKKEAILSLSDAVRGNEEEAASCGPFYYDSECKLNPLIEKYLVVRPKTEPLDRYCSIQLDATSNQIIMITGNSFVYFQIHGLIDAIKQSKTKFSEAFILTHPFCNIIAGSLNNYIPQSCGGIDTSHNELLNAIKPDIIIHSARIDHFVHQFLGNFSEDKEYEEIKKSILNIASYTRKLILIEPHPPFSRKDYLNPLSIAHTLLINGTLNKFGISSEDFHKSHDPSWDRVKEAAKHCSNCVIVSTHEIMCPAKVCPMVDPVSELGIFCDNFHITPRQSLKFMPNIINAIDSDL